MPRILAQQRPSPPRIGGLAFTRCGLTGRRLPSARLNVWDGGTEFPEPVDRFPVLRRQRAEPRLERLWVNATRGDALQLHTFEIADHAQLGDVRVAMTDQMLDVVESGIELARLARCLVSLAARRSARWPTTQAASR